MPAWRRPSLLLAAAVAMGVAACTSSQAPERKPPPPRWTVSPNGEPLPFRPGQDDCRAALSAWFAQADANGDGVLDLAEMQADAARWFARADLDRDGQITSDELAGVRRAILPEPEPEPEPDPALGPRGRVAALRQQARPDPVMQADANADFRVSRAEFQAYVAARFAEAAKGGVVSRAQVVDTCSRGAE
jgi:hypothetical protein